MSDQENKSSLSRRDFLKTAGSGALGTTVLASLPPGVADAGRVDEQKAGSVPLVLRVNGQVQSLVIDPGETLLEVIRDRMHLTGTKKTCNRGMCGACTVLLDGKPVYSCHMLALDAAGAEVVTIEGLLEGEELHPVQQAFVDHDGLQCGFCTPGQIMAAQGLLIRYPKPTREQVLTGMSGNICRCSAYPKIIESVLAAAKAAGGER
jgi:xanthine dehydrogenase YagT iron-sulfur-binding subunit